MLTSRYPSSFTNCIIIPLQIRNCHSVYKYTFMLIRNLVGCANSCGDMKLFTSEDLPLAQPCLALLSV